ncbi:hypothetical protein RB213_004805 [Colletotrichum asianum]
MPNLCRKMMIYACGQSKNTFEYSMELLSYPNVGLDSMSRANTSMIQRATSLVTMLLQFPPPDLGGSRVWG